LGPYFYGQYAKAQTSGSMIVPSLKQRGARLLSDHCAHWPKALFYIQS
jgi:hypothetical protein